MRVDFAGQAPATSTIRRTTSAEAKSQTEQNIRVGHELLRFWGIAMSHNRLVKHARRFDREVSGFTFFDYLANAVQVDGQRRAEERSELEAYLRARFAMDPVGVTAIRNVMRGGGGRASS